MSVTPTDLYAFGSRDGPRPPRVGFDVKPDSAGMLEPGKPPFPRGVSTFADPAQAPLTRHYHKLPKGTPLPEGLDVLADGVDVNKASKHRAGHHTIYPVVRMHLDQFTELYLKLPWEYAGKKP